VSDRPSFAAVSLCYIFSWRKYETANCCPGMTSYCGSSCGRSCVIPLSLSPSRWVQNKSSPASVNFLSCSRQNSLVICHFQPFLFHSYFTFLLQWTQINFIFSFLWNLVVTSFIRLKQCNNYIRLYYDFVIKETPNSLGQRDTRFCVPLLGVTYNETK
jgi:hypothetical protein